VFCKNFLSDLLVLKKKLVENQIDFEKIKFLPKHTRQLI